MPQYWTKTHKFIECAARLEDLIYFCVRQNDLEEDEVPHSIFIAWYAGKWFQEEHVNWNTAGMTVVRVPSEKAIAISENGDVWTYVGGVKTREQVGASARLLRGVTTVDGEAYAFGMDRQVFRRSGEGTWTPMHAAAPSKGTTVGFEALDGFSANDMYAVGWEGEIWRYDGKGWARAGSPTNKILTGVACGDDGNVYVCGQDGLLLVGRGDQWSIVEEGGTMQDFWDVIWYDGTAFLATMTMLFTYRNGSIDLVNFGQGDYPETCYRLTKAGGVLWSMGVTDVFCFNGAVWTRVE